MKKRDKFDKILRNTGVLHCVLYYTLQEIQCLQEHLDSLEVECQEVIGNFTEDEDEMPELDVILMKACTPMINKFCDTVCANQAVLISLKTEMQLKSLWYYISCTMFDFFKSSVHHIEA